jgi:hypothetical protein
VNLEGWPRPLARRVRWLVLRSDLRRLRHFQMAFLQRRQRRRREGFDICVLGRFGLRLKFLCVLLVIRHPGLEIYGLSTDCRTQQLLSSLAIGTPGGGGAVAPLVGHEGSWAPDGSHTMAVI